MPQQAFVYPGSRLVMEESGICSEIEDRGEASKASDSEDRFENCLFRGCRDCIPASLVRDAIPSPSALLLIEPTRAEKERIVG
jgi:hypothetical protein